MTTRRMGEEGMRWFIAKVEDINDPQKLGRVKIRVIGEHDNPSITTEDLLWATPIIPITSASHAGVGTSPTGLTIGSHVFGFYLDGHEKQLPILWGSYAKIPDGTQKSNDLPKRAIEINNINNSLVGPEPAAAYAAKYPYNNVVQSKSGHIIEIDDTPGNERLHTYHKSGTYTEINKDGQRVSKIVDNDIEVVVKDKTVYISGDCNITVLGNLNITGKKNVTIHTDNDVAISAPGGLNITKGSLYVEGSISSSVGATGVFDSDGTNITVINGIVTNIE